MSTEENPHAGRGSAVPVDIGGDIGALVLTMPPDLEGSEVEIRPTDSSTRPHDPAHVAVVARPTPNGSAMHAAVFFEVPAGSYELYRRPDGPVRLRVDVCGGEVTHATWPTPEEGDHDA
ncbi:MAG: hypothetical protein ACRDTT_09385 [Pseudonocardiaceae bacterium]